MKRYFTQMKLNNFDSSGNYLGVNMNDSSFLQRDTSKDMEEYMCEDHAMYDEYMKFILDNSISGVVLLSSYTISDFKTKKEVEEANDKEYDDDGGVLSLLNEEVSFNLNGESISQLSQTRCDVDESNDIDIPRHGTTYNQLYPVFDRLIQNIRTQDQINIAIETF